MALLAPQWAPRILLKILVKDRVLCLFHTNCY